MPERRGGRTRFFCVADAGVRAGFCLRVGVCVMMNSTYEQRVFEAIETEGQIRAGDDKIVTRKFGAVARILWPAKTAAHIAAIAGRDERTAKRWLSGEFEPPISVVLAVVNETFRVQ